MKYIDKKKTIPRWKDLHTHRKWTSSAAILSWGWSRVVSSIRRCPRCPSTTCCSSSCREKVDACPVKTASHGSAWIPTPSVPPATGSKLPSTIGRRPCHPLRRLRPNDYSLELVSTCRVVLRQIDLPVWREIKMVEDLFIDRRSMAPPMDPYRAGLEEKNGRGRPQPDL